MFVCCASEGFGQVETVIHNFLGGKNGSQPMAPVTVLGDHVGGTTYNGGESFVGKVFKLTPETGQPEWTFRRLFSFTGTTTGVIPMGAVIASKNGVLYGTAIESTPNNGCGVVYELVPPSGGQTTWTENIIYQFTCLGDGMRPIGRLAKDGKGALYGVTKFGGGASGCGTVFKLIPPSSGQTNWSFATIYTFAGGTADGCTPNGDLLYDSVSKMIFGTTISGGLRGLGTVYGLTPTGPLSYTKTGIHDFEGDANDAHDGALPNGGLVGGAGDLWGTTYSGGASNNCCGIVFQLVQEISGDPNYTLIVQHQFTGGQDGATPMAGLYEDASRRVWGTTYKGGPVQRGAISELFSSFIPTRYESVYTTTRFLTPSTVARRMAPFRARL